MTIEPSEGLDWLGCKIDCRTCLHRELKDKGGCQPLRACVRDRYARRIDRFFDWNPSLGNVYLDDPYFEVRACAARVADVFRLPDLLDDPDETVRWSALRRLPRQYLLRLRFDQHREVRLRVAQKLDGADLVPMVRDVDYFVRQIVARRLPPDLVSLLISDDDAEVRRVVAHRIPRKDVMRLVGDPEGGVRLLIAKRIDDADLGMLAKDCDWRVRHEVALRGPRQVAAELIDDEDDFVSQAARARFAETMTADALDDKSRGVVVELFGSARRSGSATVSGRRQ